MISWCGLLMGRGAGEHGRALRQSERAAGKCPGGLFPLETCLEAMSAVVNYHALKGCGLPSSQLRQLNSWVCTSPYSHGSIDETSTKYP
ncbi:MAG TPA: hypothetical protein VK436_15190 [Methanocella sp.]|nr:hypothetical protein [Methanocella sp.]